MTLLPPGRVFLDHARAILAAIDSAVIATRAEVGLLATANLHAAPPRSTGEGGAA
jgi:hypothetical protein